MRAGQPEIQRDISVSFKKRIVTLIPHGCHPELVEGSLGGCTPSLWSEFTEPIRCRDSAIHEEVAAGNKRAVRT